MVGLYVHQNVVGLMNLINWVCELPSTPVFRAVKNAARFGNQTLVFLNHRRHLLALIRMDQKNDLIVSHCLTFWVKSHRMLCKTDRSARVNYSFPVKPVKQGFRLY